MGGDPIHGDDQYSEFNQLLLKGFSAQLEQIYVMSSINTIPFLDKPADVLFYDGHDVVNFGFQTTKYTNDFVLQGLKRGEKWTFQHLWGETENTYYEHGYGSSYFITSTSITPQYISIVSNNKQAGVDFLSLFYPDGVYNYRGADNVTFSILTPSNNSEWEETNLKLTVLTDLGKVALFESPYFYMDTNPQYYLQHYVDYPLTGSKVKEIIENGIEGVDWELYPRNGKTYYKIGVNLYTPTFGNTYKYEGSINQAGMPSSFSRVYYRFKFKIVG
jgi:hypothetical protein